SFGINCVLVRRLVLRHSHRTVAIVLRCVMLRISRKEIAMFAADKAPAQSVPRILDKLVAILHADVAGFSRLMGVDEVGTHRVLGELRRAVDPLIASDGGRIVGTAGDSFLADFSS